MNEQRPVERVEAQNAKANRVLVGVAVAALVVIIVTGATTVALQVRENAKAAGDRKVLLSIGRELRDCTTPEPTPCQKRMADANRPVLKALSEDNLRASVAVGTCLRSGVPVEQLEACALAKFREATEAATPSP